MCMIINRDGVVIFLVVSLAIVLSATEGLLASVFVLVEDILILFSVTFVVSRSLHSANE